jgi:DNA-binding MarR family transcriptional regulator
MVTMDLDERSRIVAAAWVLIAAELSWMGNRADTDLSLDTVEGRALMLLTMQPCWRMRVLREVLGTSPEVMTRLVNRFVERGWAVRVGPSQDRRGRVIAPTQAGRTAWEEALERRIDALLQLGPMVSEHDVEVAEALLARVTSMAQCFSRAGERGGRFYRRARFADRIRIPW